MSKFLKKVQRAFWVSKEEFDLIEEAWRKSAQDESWDKSVMKWIGSIVIKHCKERLNKDE